MKTLVISDIHFGNGKGYDIYAGGEALPAFLDLYAAEPTRVIIAGDSVDFLMNEDPLELDVERAVGQARDIATSEDTAVAFQALGRVLGHGGEVIIRLGNHDVEVALPQVQEVFRQALAQPPEVAARLEFQLGNKPLVLEENGVRVLISHGEHTDPWNRINYHQLMDGDKLGDAAGFSYPPGSRLVKTLMNPLKRSYKMRFADLLKPDFQGATLTALAVDPTAVKTLFKKSTVKLLWQLFRRMGGDSPFAPGEEPEDLGIHDRLKEAALTMEEQAALEGLLAEDAVVSFAPGDDKVLDRALLKLGRAGLKVFAAAQRGLAGDTGEKYFRLEPDKDEWKEAQRLAAKFKTQAVVLGHTHAARFLAEDGLTFINTGTWIWLMRLPSSEADDETWAHYLSMLQQNPGLDPQVGVHPPLISRFTGALLEPVEEGAAISLLEWSPAGTVKVLGKQTFQPVQ